MKKFLIILFSLSLSLHASATETPVIQPGKDYKKYSHEELQKRVWQLEQAFQQLQENSKKQAEQTTSLIETAKAKEKASSTQWTCYIRTSGFFASSDPTKELATQNALEKCRNNSAPIHCKEAYVKCDEEKIQK